MNLGIFQTHVLSCRAGLICPALEITLEKNRRGNAINDTFPLLPADVGGDQQIFGGSRRHPFVPRHDRNGEHRFKLRDEVLNRLGCRPDFPVQTERQTHKNLGYVVLLHELLDMCEISRQRPSNVGLKRLSRPSQLIAESHPDPFGTMVDCENPRRLHEFTAPGPFQPIQRSFPTQDRVLPDSFPRLEPSPVDLRRFLPLPRPSL